LTVEQARKEAQKLLGKIAIGIDLRRTFITVAESLDISACAMKRLLNHNMSADVTAGYIISAVERLRKPMQQVTDFIVKAAGIDCNKV
jgi:hypothetical protein